MNLSDVWERLEEDTRAAGVSGRMQRRIGPEGRRNFFLGLDLPSRHRMLVLRVAATSAEGQPTISDSSGLIVRSTPGTNDKDEVEIELILTDPQHSDIFDLLIRDLVEAAEEPVSERSGLSRFLSRLSDWQQLLRRLTPRGLAPEAQQGLWGELWVLREVIAPAMGVAEAVQAWRGPLGSDQDFQIGTINVEVKTSTRHGPDLIAISSERQLEVPEGVALMLVVMSLDSRVGYGETLPEIVRNSRTAASGAGCLGLLDDRLSLLGYGAKDESLYSEAGYSVRSFHPFLIRDGFPMIVSSDLPPGVAGVRYSISIHSCGPYKIAVEEPSKLLMELI